MISVFNRLTKPELEDCLVFESIIENHFEKFRYFYLILKLLSLDNVKNISCVEHGQSLAVCISCDTKDDMKELKEDIKEYISDDDEYSKYFDVSLKRKKNKLNISIENKEEFYGEEIVIYEDRFNSY